LQLCDALAFAHSRGVAHHDVKAANILIDASAGGKLLLADFGSALKPGEETVGFTKSYASPGMLIFIF
jgi:serine/threonine protein kinase